MSKTHLHYVMPLHSNWLTQDMLQVRKSGLHGVARLSQNFNIWRLNVKLKIQLRLVHINFYILPRLQVQPATVQRCNICSSDITTCAEKPWNDRKQLL